MIMVLPSGFKTKEEYAKYMRHYNQRQRNRLAFLELEVLRLQKCLLHKVSVPALEHNYDDGDDLFVVVT